MEQSGFSPYRLRTDTSITTGPPSTATCRTYRLCSQSEGQPHPGHTTPTPSRVHATIRINSAPAHPLSTCTAAGDIRVTTISPGVTESGLAESLSDPEGRERMRTYRSVAIPASSVAAAIAFAMDQPAGVDVSEIIVRPTAGRT